MNTIVTINSIKIKYVNGRAKFNVQPIIGIRFGNQTLGSAKL